ncbi:MAG: hydroxymethylglutaryl-CoA reductase, degradative [Candidatus Micrarchaeia archaeon]
MTRKTFSGFYKLPVEKRLEKLKEFANLSDDEVQVLQKQGGLKLETANRMIENVAGTFPLPLGLAVNFKINGKEKIIPMAIEEPSVVAAASNSAKLALPGGFQAEANEPVMIGQIQLVGVKDTQTASNKILEKKDELIQQANAHDAPLVKHGGGVRDIDTKTLETPRGKMLIVLIFVDTRDAMGANAVNTFAEKIAPTLEELSEGKIRLRILSNLATKRMARAKAVWKKEVIGEDVVEGILDAYEFAKADQHRATTNNKGVMNGIDALVVATGNDWRAIEAGAHSYAAITGKYLPLAKYSKNENNDLIGEIELPMALGLVGGATKTHPVAKISVKILNVKTAKELSEIAAAVGLAQNFAALRALASEGIQRGHLQLHAKNYAVMAGATGELIDKVASQMEKEGKVSLDGAAEILKRN